MNKRSLILPLLAPLVLLGLAFGWLLQSNTLNIFDSSAPPAEELTFEHEIEVATPKRDGLSASLQAQTLLGAYVGILPVLIGLMFFPLLRRLAGSGMQFVLAITLGMLGFLLIDLLEEAIEAAHQSAAAFQGTTMVLIVAGAVFLVLTGIGRRHGTPSGLALASLYRAGDWSA